MSLRQRRSERALLQAAERGVDWWLWRVATDPRLPDGWDQVRRWSFADVLDAHLVLDALTESEAALRPDPPG